MDRRTTTVYLAGAVVVWVGTLIALAVVLSGTGRFGEVLTILLGPVVWFLLLVPAGLSRAGRSRSAAPTSRGTGRTGHDGGTNG